jgi:hypothetical protein
MDVRAGVVRGEPGISLAGLRQTGSVDDGGMKRAAASPDRAGHLLASYAFRVNRATGISAIQRHIILERPVRALHRSPGLVQMSPLRPCERIRNSRVSKQVDDCKDRRAPQGCQGADTDMGCCGGVCLPYSTAS